MMFTRLGVSIEVDRSAEFFALGRHWVALVQGPDIAIRERVSVAEQVRRLRIEQERRMQAALRKLLHPGLRARIGLDLAIALTIALLASYACAGRGAGGAVVAAVATFGLMCTRLLLCPNIPAAAHTLVDLAHELPGPDPASRTPAWYPGIVGDIDQGLTRIQNLDALHQAGLPRRQREELAQAALVALHVAAPGWRLCDES